MGPFVLIITLLFNMVCGDVRAKFFIDNKKSTLKQSCGIDNSPIKVVYEGTGSIQTYPWLGTLYYPIRNKRFITTVVLINKQVVIGSAIDIDKLPKTDFRSRSRVVLGNTCSGPSIRVREYSYHPTYNRTTYSALVLIQLETEFLIQELRPICAPPSIWDKPQFYAMVLSKDCSDSKLEIHKMSPVSMQKCRSYYGKTGLDVASMWPTHTVCARTLHGKECVWKNGAVLMLRQNNTWSLLGFGIAGPGCRAPARFIDYTLSYVWTSHSIARIGRPTVTRIADNHLIMRRTTSSLQRYGFCDPEEIKAEIYTDTTTIAMQPKIEMRQVKYNFTILSKMEYTCIVFRVDNLHKEYDPKPGRPIINLRRICTSPKAICYTSQYLQVDFYVDIKFTGDVTYKVAAYGEEIKILDIKKVMAYTNHKRNFPEISDERKENLIRKSDAKPKENTSNKQKHKQIVIDTVR